MAQDSSKGFTCSCGEEIAFTRYVYEHPDKALLYTCLKCLRDYTIKAGVVTEDGK